MASLEKTPVVIGLKILYLSRVVGKVQEVPERSTANVCHYERVSIGGVGQWSVEMSLKPRTGQRKDQLVGSDLCLVRKDDCDICEGISDERRLFAETGEKLRDILSGPSPVGTHCLYLLTLRMILRVYNPNEDPANLNLSDL